MLVRILAHEEKEQGEVWLKWAARDQENRVVMQQIVLSPASPQLCI